MKKAVILASVKGGAGKSLFAAATALALARKGVKAAVLDFDLDSAHAPDFLPPLDTPMKLLDNRTFQPGRVDGLEVFSMSLLVDPSKAVSITGRDHTQVISDVAHNTRWESEVFVLDLPAGSSDTFLAAVRTFAPLLVGGVVVTQPAFPVDTKRVLDLFKTHGIPLLGLVENMAGFKCEKCAEVHPVFGQGVADGLAKEFGIDSVWKVPLSMKIRAAVEARNPLLAPEVAEVADKVVERVLAASPEKVGIAQRLKAKVKEIATEAFADIIGSILLVANKDIPLRNWQAEFGLNAAQNIGLVLTNPAGDKTVLSNYFRIKDGKLQVVKAPSRTDVVIETDYQTLAACLLDDGSPAPAKFINAYLAGRLRFYGDGAFPQAIFVIQNVFASDGVVRNVNDRFGRVLKVLASGGE